MILTGRIWKRAAIVATFVLSVSFNSNADEIEIPFGLYAEDFKAETLKQGLDLSGSRESRGFVEDKGGHFKVYTYRTAKPEELEIIKNVAFKTIRE
jgi:hypothetical protein